MKILLCSCLIFIFHTSNAQSDMINSDQSSKWIHELKSTYSFVHDLGLDTLQKINVIKLPDFKKILNKDQNVLLGVSKNTGTLWIGQKSESKISWVGITEDPARLNQSDNIEIMKWDSLNMATMGGEIDTYSYREKGSNEKSIQELLKLNLVSAQSDVNVPVNIKVNLSSNLRIPTIGILPSIWNLSDYVPYIGDQRGIWACSAWAVADLKSIEDNIRLKRTFKDKNHPESFYSPSFIFSKAKEILGEPDPKTGIDLAVALNILAYFGVPSYNTCPYYTNDFNCKIDITEPMLSEAMKNKIKLTDPVPVSLNINEFQYVLSHNCPIGVEALIDDNFMSQMNSVLAIDKSFIWSAYKGTEAALQRKRHSMVCVGYNDNKKAFLMVTSFGNLFGENGFFWIDYNFMFKAVDKAFRIKCMEFDNDRSMDARIIAGLNRYTNKQIQTIPLGEGLIKIKAFDLDWYCSSVDFTDNQESVHLKVYDDDVIIRQDFNVTYGFVKYLTRGSFLYIVRLIELQTPTTELFGLRNIPAKAVVEITKVNGLTSINDLTKF